MAEDYRTFRKGQALYCRKAFKFGGRPFERGDIFNEKNQATNARQIQRLLNANYLTHQEIEVTVKAAPVKEVEPPTPIPDAVTEADLAEMDDIELAGVVAEHALGVNPDDYETLEAYRDAIWVALSAAPVFTIEDKGGGWFNVLKDGNPVNEKGLRKEAAEGLLLQLNSAPKE